MATCKVDNNKYIIVDGIKFVKSEKIKDGKKYIGFEGKLKSGVSVWCLEKDIASMHIIIKDKNHDKDSVCGSNLVITGTSNKDIFNVKGNNNMIYMSQPKQIKPGRYEGDEIEVSSGKDNKIILSSGVTIEQKKGKEGILIKAFQSYIKEDKEYNIPAHYIDSILAENCIIKGTTGKDDFYVNGNNNLAIGSSQVKPGRYEEDNIVMGGKDNKIKSSSGITIEGKKKGQVLCFSNSQQKDKDFLINVNHCIINGTPGTDNIDISCSTDDYVDLTGGSKRVQNNKLVLFHNTNIVVKKSKGDEVTGLKF